MLLCLQGDRGAVAVAMGVALVAVVGLRGVRGRLHSAMRAAATTSTHSTRQSGIRSWTRSDMCCVSTSSPPGRSGV